MDPQPLSIGDIPALTAVGTYTATNSSATLVGSGTPLLAGQKVILQNSTGVIGTVAIDSNGNNITLNDKWAGVTATGTLYTTTDYIPEDVADYYTRCDALGTLAQRSTYDAQPNGFVYLQTDVTPVYWIRTGTTSGIWFDAALNVFAWVATTGDDTTGDGSFDLPLKTIQAGVNLATSVGDLSGLNAYVVLKAGTYNESVVLKDVFGTPLLIEICGEESLTGTHVPANYVLNSVSPIAAIQATNLKTAWTLEGFTLTSTKGHLLQAKGARLRFNRLRFGQAAGAHMAALAAGSIVLAGSAYTISGGGSAHLLANGSGGTIDLQAESTVPSPTITITTGGAAPTFKTAFAWARASGHIFTGTGLIFTGAIGKTSVIGKRWRAEQNSSIDTGQSGEKYLPGTALAAGNGVAVKNGEYI